MGYINESVIYNIYPLGFCGAPKENDFKQEYRLDKIYGWIDHMKSMSVNALVFNPVFESSKHGYDTIDYKKIDCRLGDNESFKKICKTLHDNGIRIMLDGVFNHVGRDFFAFKDVQQNRENSRYASWFENVNFRNNNPYNDGFSYEGWAGYYDLVKLNLHNDEVVNYLLDCARFWIDEFDIDGLRLDAADCIDIEFFKKLKMFAKRKSPISGSTVRLPTAITIIGQIPMYLTRLQTTNATKAFIQAIMTTTILKLLILLTDSLLTAVFTETSTHIISLITTM